jgi:Rps23 Pro-64 3,4-dihydroxylase Tpa1-like proline 4-hydroxylase
MEVDIEFLDRFAAENRETYANADPFPHIMIDNFIRPEVIEGVLEEVETREPEGSVMDDRFQKKWACNKTRLMGPRTRNLINFLNGQEITDFLTTLTGIKGLVPDPQLAGGGLHELRNSGFLNVHADFNYHKALKLDRRINLLLYLNKDWEESNGGELQLWDREMKNCVASYLPIFNRCVIFSTTEKSFHGNPNPVKLPDNRRARRSIAFYYYTNGRPADEVGDPHMTVFRQLPGEESAGDRARRISRRWLPPVIADVLDSMRR